jgi:hypothetical protein
MEALHTLSGIPQPQRQGPSLELGYVHMSPNFTHLAKISQNGLGLFTKARVRVTEAEYAVLYPSSTASASTSVASAAFIILLPGLRRWMACERRSLSEGVNGGTDLEPGSRPRGVGQRSTEGR